MRYFSADYIFPISTPPVKNGIVAVTDDGVIGDVHQPGELGSSVEIEFFPGILCPGFINAHCHLELSYLKGQISEGKGLPRFISEIEAIRRNFSADEIQHSIELAEQEMINNGIVGVGDISNSNFSFHQKNKKKLKYHTFIEALGFHPDGAENAFNSCLNLFEQYKNSLNLSDVSITPHAPYSASVKLLNKIKKFAEKNDSILSIHNQENEEENKMFMDGTGKIIECLNVLGIDTSLWKSTGRPSMESLLDYLPEENKILFVHNTFTRKKDMERISQPRTANLYFCFCPNANLYIENRLPDFNLFLDYQDKLLVGTDSLASNHGLSVLSELKVIAEASPAITLQTLLTWATKNGAEFFGWKELGTFEKSKKPGINWILDLDIENLQLLPGSQVRKVV